MSASSADASTAAAAAASSPAPALHRAASVAGLGEHCGNQPFLRTDDEVKRILGEYFQHLTERTEHHLGYPYNLHFSAGDLKPFLEFSINNLGDPFKESNYGVHSRRFEIEVLDFFAQLWGIELDNYWGYTTTCGTEGNLLGILYGREKLPAGKLYYSRESHYSVPKAGHFYRVPLEPVNCSISGEIDYDDLEAKLIANKGLPAIVSMNAGTTVKGAVDSLAKIQAVLAKAGYTSEDSYIHCDGALAGLLLPFHAETTERAHDYHISFKDGIDSISVSGHKMLGCPMPCGVVITKKEHMTRFAKDVEYLNSTDTTIMGSRNGQASLAMWYALQRKFGVQGLEKDCVMCFENAEYLFNLFQEHKVSSMLNEFSTTVVFEKPSDEIVKKWQLACVGNIAHVVVMPSVDRNKLKDFFDEFVAARNAAAAPAGSICTKANIGQHCLCNACVPAKQ